MKSLTAKDFKKSFEDEMATPATLWGNKDGEVIISVADIRIKEVNFNEINKRIAFIESSKEAVIQNMIEDIFPDRDNQDATEDDFKRAVVLREICIFPEYEYRAEIGVDLPEEYFGDHFITGYLEGNYEWDGFTIDG